MSSFHGMFSLGGLAGAARAGGAMQGGLPPRAHLAITAAVLGMTVLAAWPALLPTAPAVADGPAFALPRGPLIGLGLVAVIGLMAAGAMGDWSAVYLRMDLGATAGTAALGFAAFSLAMAVGRLTGDRVVGRFGAAGGLAAGALIGAGTLGGALLVGHPTVAMAGFAGMGLGLANVVPIVVSAAGRPAGLAPGIGIAGVSTAGCLGFLSRATPDRPGRRGERPCGSPRSGRRGGRPDGALRRRVAEPGAPGDGARRLIRPAARAPSPPRPRSRGRRQSG